MIHKIAVAENIQYDFADNEFFVNGKRFYDGIPMISLNIPSQKKALRIIQEEAEDEVFEFGAWIEKKEITDSVFFSELVISLVLTNKTNEFTKELLCKWFNSQISEKEMTAKINTLLP